MLRVNTIVENDDIPKRVKQSMDLTWEELIVQGAEALEEVEA